MSQLAGTLDAATARALAAFFGTGLDAIAVTTDREPEARGALALARPGRISLSPALAALPRPVREGIVAHEIAHVLQQAAGREAGPAGADGLTVDPGLEAEAALIGTLFATRDGDDGASAGAARARAILTARGPGAAAMVQPVVKIAGNVGTFDYLWAGVEHHHVLTTLGVTPAEKRQIKTKLGHWVKAPAKRSFFSLASKGHDKNFRSMENLCRALVGRVRSVGSRRTEAALAARVDSSAALQTQIHSALLRIYRSMLNYLRLNGPALQEFRAELQSRQTRQRYGYFYNGLMGSNTLAQAQREIVRNSGTAAHKMAAYLCDYALVARDYVPDAQNGGVDFALPFEDARNTHFNVNESAAWVIQARLNNIRLGAGPSATTAQVCKVAVFAMKYDNYRDGRPMQLTEYDKDDIRAIGLALFAFWNRHMSKKMSEIHTYHEVMIALQGYGIEIERNGVALGQFEYPQLDEIP